MKLNITINFKVRYKEVKCIAIIDKKTYVCTKRIQQQADRVDAVKRAKELAYLGTMIKVHGYVCTRKLSKETCNEN